MHFLISSEFLHYLVASTHFTDHSKWGRKKKKVEMKVLPAKYAGLPCFNTQPGAESFKAGVFQQLHCSLQDP